MADEGFVLLWRKAFSHELWAEERVLSRWEAWVDLWAHQAAYAEHKKLIGGEVVTVARGQLIASERFLAVRWRWPVRRVRRFLAYLASNDMMRRVRLVAAGRSKIGSGNGSIYIVVNYELLQNLVAATVAPTERQGRGKGAKRSKGSKGIQEQITDASDVRLVFDHWVSRTHRDPARTRLTKEREAKINARLVRFSVDDLMRAVDGVMQSEFHRSKPEYTDLTSCFGNDSKVEQHIEHASTPVQNGSVLADVRRFLTLAGPSLTIPAGREAALAHVREKDPALCDRLAPVLAKLDLPMLARLAATHNGKELDRQITAQLR